MHKLVFQTDDEELFYGEGPTTNKVWLNARIYQTASSTYELMMEYWDSKTGRSEEVLFSKFKNLDTAIFEAKRTLKNKKSNFN